MTGSMWLRVTVRTRVVAVALLLLAGCSGESGKGVSAGGVPEGEPPFAVVDRDGLVARVREMEGSVVVVDYWGTWCPRCREQLPQVLSLAQANKSRGVELLTVALERPEDLKLAREFLAAQVYVPPTVASVHGRSGKSCREFGIDECSVPFYRVFDRKGNEVGTITSTEFADVKLLELIDRAVKGEAVGKVE
jgi:thiol-disulfide isomerase/thioredoxin